MSADVPTSSPTEPPPRSQGDQKQPAADAAVHRADPGAVARHRLGRPHPAAQFGDADLCRRRPQQRRGAFRRQARRRAEEQRFAARLKIVTTPTTPRRSRNSTAQADLAVLRTDAKIPPRARAIAILEHDVVLLLSPGSKKIKSFDDLKKKKIAVWADSDNSAAFVRNIFDFTDSPGRREVQMAPPGSTLDKLFASRLRRRHRGRAHLAGRCRTRATSNSPRRAASH